MTGYTFTLTCPHCGGVMRHVADGAFSPYGSVALASCTECGSRCPPVRAPGTGVAARTVGRPTRTARTGLSRLRNLNAEGAPLIAAMIEAGA